MNVQLKEQVCVQLPTPAVNATLLAFADKRRAAALLLLRRPCSNRSISPTSRAHSSKPAAVEYGGLPGRMVGQTDGRRDGQTDGRPTLA